jgi:hypothetical protein
MRFKTPKCPECGESPSYIIEHLTAAALLQEPDENGNQEYAGESKMHWETQEPMGIGLDVGPQMYRVGCENRHEWETYLDE